MASGNFTTRFIVLVGVVVMAINADAIAQGSRLNFRGSPSRLNQRGPVVKVANPAAPLKMPAKQPPRPKPPGNGGGHGGNGGGGGHGGHGGHHHHHYPYYAYSGGYYDYYGWNRRKTYDGPLYVEQVRKYDPQIINEPPAPPREVDQGLEALRRGDYRVAADIISRRIAEQERQEAKETPETGFSDREDQRLLVIALIGEKRMDDALHHALEAYRKDASLRRRPVLGSSIIPSKIERTRLVRTAVTYAQRRDSDPSAWLLAAIMMEADGRSDDARRVLAREQIDLDALIPQSAPANITPPAPGKATSESAQPEPPDA